MNVDTLIHLLEVFLRENPEKSLSEVSIKDGKLCVDGKSIFDKPFISLYNIRIE